MKKRLISMALVLVMVLGLLPVSALAVSAEDFTDLKANAWYYEYIDFVVDKGYFNGMSETEFQPKTEMTRAMFVTVIARVEGAEVDNTAESSFPDCKSGTWYTGSVEWAAENGIVNGYEDGTFRPHGNVTRQEMCTIMDRYIAWRCEQTGEEHVTDGEDITFTDAANIAAFAKEAVANCVTYGLVEGYPDGTFLPRNNSTRAEVAAVICRLDWIVHETPDNPVTPNPPSPPAPVGEYTLTVNYLDENGDALIPAIIKNVKEGAAYTTQQKAFLGYDFVSVTGDAASGTMDGNKTVNYNYKKTVAVTNKYTLTVNYLDDAGNALAPAVVTENMAEGTAYTTEMKFFKGYTFVGTTGDATEGIMDGNKVVNYIYRAPVDYIYNGVSGAAADLAGLAESYVVKANKLSNEYKAYIAALDELVSDIDFGNYVDAGYEFGTASALRHPVTIEAGLQLNQNTANNLVKIAAGSAVMILGDENFVTWDEVKAIVDAVKDDLALFGLSPISEVDAAQITELIYNYIKSKGNIWTDNFKGAEGYYTGDIRVACGDFKATVTVSDEGVSIDNWKKQGVKFAAAIAKAIYSDVTSKATDYVYEMSDVEALIEVTFSAGAYAEDTDFFPYYYPVTLNLDFVNDVEFLQYKYAGYNHLKLVVSEKEQAKLQELATKIKNSDYVEELISEVVGAVVNGDPIEFNFAGSASGDTATLPVDQIVEILTKYGRTATGSPMTEAQAETLVEDYLTLWVETNVGNGTDSSNWDNTAIYGLVNVVADQVFEGVNDELDKHGLALSKNVTPAQLEENIKKAGVNIDVNEGVKNYVIAVICDEARGETYYSAEDYVPEDGGVNAYNGMSSYINESVENTISNNPEFEKAMEYAEKVYAVLDDMSLMADIQLGNLATALRIDAMQDYVASKGDESYIAKVCAYLEKIPAGASATIAGVKIDKALLTDLRNAETVEEVCNALAAILELPGLADMDIGDFAPVAGQDISVSYEGKTFTANFVIEIQ